MMENQRNYGILMPISALPSEEGIGTLGKSSYDFVDFLARAGAAVWQVLPLNPTNYGDSPYQSCSSVALNYYFIDLRELVKEGLLTEEELRSTPLCGSERRVDYGKQFYHKIDLLRKAFTRFRQDGAFAAFVSDGEFYDFAVFMALKAKFDFKAFTEWDEEFCRYDEERVEQFVAENREEILFWQFTQYLFLLQWNKLKAYANGKGIKIMGDIPLYVAYDSVEVWKYGDKLFRMDGERTPLGVAGCPPDAFSADGQLWGNPVYDWEKMEGDGFRWWRKRIDRCFEYFDILRIDHFRGFDRYWEIPYGDENAVGGVWKDGPKDKLFKGETREIVAEDLGTIDEGVRSLMRGLGFAGMKVVIFAFDGNEYNEYKPSNVPENCYCYTGTHDTDPFRAYVDKLGEEELRRLRAELRVQCKKLGVKPDLGSPKSITRTAIKLSLACKARTVILPMWDILCLGEEARFNLPSTVSEKNWSWKFLPEEFGKRRAGYLKKLKQTFGR